MLKTWRLAKEISKLLKVPYYELDNMIWDRSVENRRFPQKIRDAELHRSEDMHCVNKSQIFERNLIEM